MTALKLFLFDLDGTLVSTGGAGLRALGKAFKELYNIEEAQKSLVPCGKTDPAIFREIIRISLDRDTTPQEIKDISQRYLTHLADEMKNSNTQILKGVRAFVEKVASLRHIVVGLGTGNLEKGARLKLEPADLNSFFSFGGFGSDAEDRAEVLRWGHRRAEEKAEEKIPLEQVFVIGDTPLDTAAAKRAGYKSVAVATGSFTLKQLEVGEPDFLLSDLSQGECFI